MFSIIVPSYNRNREVLELLESLKAQTVYNFEVIIVDDCSPQTVVIEPNYPFEIKVFRNEINQGAAGSRNVGAQLASQEWLLFLDDDDRFANNKCEVISQYIEQHPQVNFIYHSAKCEMVNEKFQYFTNPIEPNKINLDNILLANKLGG
ncbi:MAG: glycosyltransferase family 2 protein, partial [Haemophilus parahaemolyticus]|nr:glycosyltransferase family 2 protein [Haemophilus parahaemolyticus]